MGSSHFDNLNLWSIRGSPFVSILDSQEQGAIVTPAGALLTGGKNVISSSAREPHTTTESSEDGDGGADNETMKDEYF